MIGAITAGLFSVPTAPVTNSYESISTVTVGSGGAASVVFSSIPSTFKHLQIRGIARSNRANVEDGISVRLNADTGGNYDAHNFFGNGASVGSGFTGATETRIETYLIPGNNATASSFGTVVVDILDYLDTNKKKTVRIFGGYDHNGGGYVGITSGLYTVSPVATTGVTLFPQIGTLLQEFSTFALYGIKG